MTSRMPFDPPMRHGWKTIGFAGIAASAATLFCLNASAAEPAHARITLEDAIQLALSHNPDSRSADQDVLSAKGATQTARALQNPSVFVYTLGANISPADVPIPNQYGFTWSIPFGGKRAAGIDVAKAGERAASAGRQSQRRQLAFGVEMAFVQVLLDQSLLEFAHEDEKSFQDALAINEVRYQDGKIAYGDVLKLRVQERQVEDTVRSATQQLDGDRIELARLLGVGAVTSDFTLDGSLSPSTARRDIGVRELTDEAIRHRPEYRQLRAQAESADFARTLARRQSIPDIGILADYDRIPGTAGAYDLEITAAVPIFNQNGGGITQADAAYEKARLATQSLHDQLWADASHAVEQWNMSQARLVAYGDDFVHMAKESLDISKHSYEEGRGTLIDFLDAESSYRDVQRTYRSAQADVVLAAAQIKLVSGEQLP